MKDVSPYLHQACRHIGCGAAVFECPLPGGAFADPDFRFDRIERWSAQPRFSVMHTRTLRDAAGIAVRLQSDGHRPGVRRGWAASRGSWCMARAIHAPRSRRAPSCWRREGWRARACLLAARRADPGRFGGEDGPLGRYYMGHLYGVAAEIDLRSAEVDAGIDYFQDPAGTYIRRRFTPGAELQRRMGLTNASFWADSPLIRHPAHRNGVLSLAYLALSIPPVGRMIVAESIRQHYVGDQARRLPHVANVLRDLPRTTAFLPSFHLPALSRAAAHAGLLPAQRRAAVCGALPRRAPPEPAVPRDPVRQVRRPWRAAPGHRSALLRRRRHAADPHP